MTTVGLEFLRATATTSAVIVFRLGRNPTTAAGCSIEPPQPWMTGPIATNVLGAGWSHLPLPSAPALRGLTLHVQGAALDLAVPRGFSTTAAERLLVGDGCP